MTSRVAIVAALARELRPLVHGWKLESRRDGVVVYSCANAIAAFAGMGSERARLAADAALTLGPVYRLISAGWAGGLHAGIEAGSVHAIDRVVNGVTRESFEADPLATGGGDGRLPRATLLTIDHVAGIEEKCRLRERSGADLVDMEAAAVARCARAAGIPFSAIKAVSDDHDARLPPLDRFSTGDGQFREWAFAAHVAVRPALWRAVATLARESRDSAASLCQVLESHLDEDERLRKA